MLAIWFEPNMCSQHRFQRQPAGQALGVGKHNSGAPGNNAKKAAGRRKMLGGGALGSVHTLCAQRLSETRALSHSGVNTSSQELLRAAGAAESLPKPSEGPVSGTWLAVRRERRAGSRVEGEGSRAARGPAQLLARSFLFPPRRPGEVEWVTRAHRPKTPPRARSPGAGAGLLRSSPRPPGASPRPPASRPPSRLASGATSGPRICPAGRRGVPRGRGAEAQPGLREAPSAALGARSMTSGGGCHGSGAAQGPVAAAHRPVDAHRQHDPAASSEVGWVAPRRARRGAGGPPLRLTVGPGRPALGRKRESSLGGTHAARLPEAPGCEFLFQKRRKVTGEGARGTSGPLCAGRKGVVPAAFEASPHPRKGKFETLLGYLKEAGEPRPGAEAAEAATAAGAPGVAAARGDAVCPPRSRPASPFSGRWFQPGLRGGAARSPRPASWPGVAVWKFQATRQFPKESYLAPPMAGRGWGRSGDCQVAGGELLTRCLLGAGCWVLEMLPGARQPCLPGGDGSLQVSFEGNGKVKFVTVPELPISGGFQRWKMQELSS